MRHPTHLVREDGTPQAGLCTAPQLVVCEMCRLRVTGYLWGTVSPTHWEGELLYTAHLVIQLCPRHDWLTCTCVPPSELSLGLRITPTHCVMSLCIRKHCTCMYIVSHRKMRYCIFPLSTSILIHGGHSTDAKKLYNNCTSNISNVHVHVYKYMYMHSAKHAHKIHSEMTCYNITFMDRCLIAIDKSGW